MISRSNFIKNLSHSGRILNLASLISALAIIASIKIWEKFSIHRISFRLTLCVRTRIDFKFFLLSNQLFLKNILQLVAAAVSSSPPNPSTDDDDVDDARINRKAKQLERVVRNLENEPLNADTVVERVEWVKCFGAIPMKKLKFYI